MKLIITYDHGDFWSEDNTPIEYESKKKLIEDFRKTWKKQFHNFSFMGSMFMRLSIFERYEILTLNEWFEKYKINQNAKKS